MYRSTSSQHQAVRGSVGGGQAQSIFDVVSGVSHHNTRGVKRKGKKKRVAKHPFKAHASGGHMGSIVIGAASANASSGLPYVASGGPGRTQGPSDGWRGGGKPTRKGGYSAERFDKVMGTRVRKGPFGPELFSKQLGRWTPVKAGARPRVNQLYDKADEMKMDTREGDGGGALAATMARERIKDNVARSTYGQGRDELQSLMANGQSTSGSSGAAQGVSTARELTNTGIGEIRSKTGVNPAWNDRANLHRTQLEKELKQRGTSDNTTRALAMKMLRDKDQSNPFLDYDDIVSAAEKKTPEAKMEAVRRRAGIETALGEHRGNAMRLTDAAQKHTVLKSLDAIAGEKSLDTQGEMMNVFDRDYGGILKQMDTGTDVPATSSVGVQAGESKPVTASAKTQTQGTESKSAKTQTQVSTTSTGTQSEQTNIKSGGTQTQVETASTGTSPASPSPEPAQPSPDKEEKQSSPSQTNPAETSSTGAGPDAQSIANNLGIDPGKEADKQKMRGVPESVRLHKNNAKLEAKSNPKNRVAANLAKTKDRRGQKANEKRDIGDIPETAVVEDAEPRRNRPEVSMGPDENRVEARRRAQVWDKEQDEDQPSTKKGKPAEDSAATNTPAFEEPSVMESNAAPDPGGMA